MSTNELAASRIRGTLARCAVDIRSEWKSFSASVNTRVITWADVVSRDLSPDIPIGSDRTDDNFQSRCYVRIKGSAPDSLMLLRNMSPRKWSYTSWSVSLASNDRSSACGKYVSTK